MKYLNNLYTTLFLLTLDTQITIAGLPFQNYHGKSAACQPSWSRDWHKTPVLQLPTGSQRPRHSSQHAPASWPSPAAVAWCCWRCLHSNCPTSTAQTRNSHEGIKVVLVTWQTGRLVIPPNSVVTNNWKLRYQMEEMNIFNRPFWQ